MKNKLKDKKEHKEKTKDESEAEFEALLKELEEEINKINDEHFSDETKIHIIKPNQKMFKNFFLDFLFELVISFILIWSINSFFNAIQTSFLGLCLFTLLEIIIDYSFNTYLKNKITLLYIISFGLIGNLISILSFIISGIICLQLISIEFINFGVCLLLIIGFIIIRKFVFKYFIKFKFRCERR